ncbi:unnamed protein product [Wuchereria bancrofti]|uniref:Uncharacterized protein n=1 Tax=Wuchereria bancrofti TaxID=6293 RepID=A0A3P7FFM6_WUCBA|nr:unnamed protein product [Wuchereria bancrofti]
MSFTSDYDRNDCNSCWISSDSEHSFPKMSSEDSLDQIDGKMDFNSDIEENVTGDTRYDRKKSMSRSDSELHLAPSIHSTDSLTSSVGYEQDGDKLQFNSKLECADNEIPNLVDDDFIGDEEISDNSKSVDDLLDEVDDEFIMKQLEKLIIRRNKKDNEARLRWLTFLREQKEAEEEEKQFQAYWKRRHQEDKDLWRNKDFANAIYKMCRAGYKGKHGHFDVPEQTLQQMNALYMQVTVGDYGRLFKNY